MPKIADCPGCGYPLKITDEGVIICDCPLWKHLDDMIEFPYDSDLINPEDSFAGAKDFHPTPTAEIADDEVTTGLFELESDSDEWNVTSPPLPQKTNRRVDGNDTRKPSRDEPTKRIRLTKTNDDDEKT